MEDLQFEDLEQTEASVLTVAASLSLLHSSMILCCKFSCRSAGFIWNDSKNFPFFFFFFFFFTCEIDANCAQNTWRGFAHLAAYCHSHILHPSWPKMATREVFVSSLVLLWAREERLEIYCIHKCFCFCFFNILCHIGYPFCNCSLRETDTLNNFTSSGASSSATARRRSFKNSPSERDFNIWAVYSS